MVKKDLIQEKGREEVIMTVLRVGVGKRTSYWDKRENHFISYPLPILRISLKLSKADLSLGYVYNSH